MKITDRLLGVLAAVAVLGVSLCGCSKDTNEITPQAVEKANADRIKHIDNDPTIDPQGREKMKAMMGLSNDGKGGRRGPPAAAGQH